MTARAVLTAAEEDYAEWLCQRSERERGRTPRPSTIRGTLSRLRSAERYAGAPLDVVLTDTQRVEALVSTLHGAVTPGHVRNILQCVRDYGAYAVERGTIPHAVDFVTPRARMTRRTTFYNVEDLEWLVLAAEEAGPRWHLFVLSLVDTGMRVGEALGLEWSMLRLAHEPPVYALPSTKTEPRLVVLTPRLQAAWQAPGVMARLKDGARHERDRAGTKRRRPYGRSTEVHPFPMSHSAVRDMWPRLCSDAGIENLGIHTARHSFASNLLAQGADLYAVSVLLGHASPSTTAAYYAHVRATSYAGLLGWGGDA